MKQTPLKRSSSPRKRRPVSAASPAQRAKVKDELSIVSGQGPCDPAHIWDRSVGGCDSELCVVALTRSEHRAYDEGRLDLEPYLIGSHISELQHALEHTNGSLSRLLKRISGSTTNERESG